MFGRPLDPGTKAFRFLGQQSQLPGLRPVLGQGGVIPRRGGGCPQHPYFPGILALLRAMASSTAFSCFSSSSRRDSVLLGLPDLGGGGPPEPEPAAGGFPEETPRPLPEDLGGGVKGRFLLKEHTHRQTDTLLSVLHAENLAGNPTLI